MKEDSMELCSEDFNRMLEAIENPPKPNKKLKGLFLEDGYTLVRYGRLLND